MSNNLFRKGLVAAAIAGLATTAIAGTPAFAADGVVLKANTGTALATPVDQALTLNASLAPTLPATNIAQLKYKIVTDGTFTVGAVITSGGNTAAAAYTNAATGSSSSSVGVSNFAAAAKTSTVLTPATLPTASTVNTIKVSLDAVTGNSGTANSTTGLAPDYGTSSKTVTVTAWIDSNLDGVVDAGEAQQSQTVSFLKYSELTTSAAITAPLENDTAATATYSFTNVNNEQLPQALVGGTFTKGDATSIVSANAAVASQSTDASATTVTTVTTSAAHGYKVGQVVAIASGTVANGQTAVTAGSYTILSVPSTTTFTINAGLAANSTGTYSAGGAVTPSGVVKNIAWDSTNSYFKYSVATSALVKAQAVKFAPAFNGTAVGSSVTSLITAVTVGSLSAAGVQSTTETANTDSSGNGAASVAKNKAFSAVATVQDTTTPTAVALAGKTVSVSVAVTSSAFPATAAAVTSTSATVTINGVTYTNAAALPGATGVAKLSATSDANGKVTVTGTSTGLAANDTVVLTFLADNISKTVTLTQADAAAARAYINFDASAANGQNDGVTSSVQVASGSTVAVKVTVNDQFGAPVADGKFTAFGNYQSSANRTAVNASSYSAVVANVVGGVATLSLPDFGTGTGSNVWNLSLRSINADGTYGSVTYPVVVYGTSTGNGFLYGSSAVTALTVNLSAAADLVPGVVGLTDSSYTALSQNTDKSKYLLGSTVVGYNDTAHKANLTTYGFANWDGRTSTVSAPSLTQTGSNGDAHIYGVVKSASTATYAGVAVNYAPVTISAKGLMFKVSQNGYSVYGVDSLTFNTDASGQFDVTVYSTLAGVQTVTVKSASASSLVDVAFASAASTAGKNITVTAPATALAGTSVTVSAAIADAFGNAVATTSTDAATTGTAYFSLKVTDLQGNSTTVYDGSASTPSGSVSKTLTFGVNDSGTVTVTATYDADGATTTKSPVVVTSTIKVGAAAVASLTSAGAQAQAQTGSAVSVSATAKDAAGAAIKGAVITFTATGAAYLSSATATTDANGVATVKLIGNVAGANSVVASANGTSAAAVNVAFGNSDASLSAAGKRVTAAWSFAAGKKVVISVNGVRVKSVVASSDAADSFSFNAKKGTNKVTVSVAGVVTDALTVKVKK